MKIFISYLSLHKTILIIPYSYCVHLLNQFSPECGCVAVVQTDDIGCLATSTFVHLFRSPRREVGFQGQIFSCVLAGLFFIYLFIFALFFNSGTLSSIYRRIRKGRGMSKTFIERKGRKFPFKERAVRAI